MDDGDTGRMLGGGPIEPERDKLIHNEQAKLTANTINGMALAFIVGGGVTTITGLGTVFGVGDEFVRASIWFLTGAGLHVGARIFLRTLR